MASEKRTYKLTATQGHFLLQNSAVASIPESLGVEKYTTVDRAIIQGLIAALFTELKAYSPHAQEFEVGKSIKLLFGETGNWKKEKEDGTRWLLQNPDLIHTVTLTNDAVNGAAWLCYAALVPREADARNPGGTLVNPLEASETVWPLLRVIRKSDAVMEQLGIKKFEKKKHGWSDDPFEPELVKPTPPVAETPETK